MSEGRRIIDAEAVSRLADAPSLVAVMRQAFAGETEVRPRVGYDIPAGDEINTLLLMSAWSAGLLGVKVVLVAPGNGRLGKPSINATYILMSAATGEALALIDGDALTAARTAAVSAAAADRLVPPDASRLLMVGTGALAPHLIAAHGSVRDLRSVEIWGRSPDRAQALATRLRDQGVKARAIVDLEAGVRRADIVSCATASTAPLIEGRWLKADAHLDLVGGFKPAMREADSQAVAQAAVVVDSWAALTEAGDLCAPIAEGVLDPADVLDLRALLAGAPLPDRRRTVFKSIGSSLADLAAAAEIYRRFLEPAHVPA